MTFSMTEPEETVVCLCECSDLTHIIRFTRSDWGPKYGGIEYSIDYVLNTYLPWYKRAWVATKYVFGNKVGHSSYDAVILKDEDRARIVELLNRPNDMVLLEEGSDGSA